MFDLLKDKITGFISDVSSKVKSGVAQSEKSRDEPKRQKDAAADRLAKTNLGLGTKIKSLLSKEITLSDKEIEEKVDEFEMALIEADVSLDAAETIAADLRERLKNTKFNKDKIEQQMLDIVRDVMRDVLTNAQPDPDFFTRIENSERPVKILFIGTNGTGKTTTLAKIAYILKESGFSVVIGASDTFRAAAIEQLTTHADRIGVKIVKGKYGADPSAVAFDTIEYARSKKRDVVLIDSAGRQETNLALLNELKKIRRVVKPDITVFVAEGIAGNSVVEQITKVNEVAKIDGVILTKMDCDPKGGVALSVAHLGIPIFFLGIGQDYADLVEFDVDYLLDQILS